MLHVCKRRSQIEVTLEARSERDAAAFGREARSLRDEAHLRFDA